MTRVLRLARTCWIQHLAVGNTETLKDKDMVQGDTDVGVPFQIRFNA